MNDLNYSVSKYGLNWAHVNAVMNYDILRNADKMHFNLPKRVFGV